ncbi:MAG: glycosyltransferase family 39 protein [Patescibacteria group bacterium]
MFKKYKIEIFIFLIAILLRMAVIYFVCDQQNINLSGFTEQTRPDGYYQIATNLVNNNVYSYIIDKENPPPTSLRTPGLPILIAASLSIFNSALPILFLQLIISGILPILGRIICLKITKNNRISTTAAVILALEPMGIWLSLMFISEIWFTLFFYLFILLIFKIIKNNKSHVIGNNYKIFIMAGIILGIATLFRPTTYYLPILLILIWVGYRFISKKDIMLKKIIVFILCFMIVLSPWLYRNYRAFGRVGLTSLPQAMLFGVLSPSVLAIDTGKSYLQAQQEFFISHKLTKYPEVNLGNADWFKEKAIEFLKNKPIALMKSASISTLAFFTNDGSFNLLSFTGLIEPTGLTVGQIIRMPWPQKLETARELIFSSVFFIALLRILWILVSLLFFINLFYILAKKKLSAYPAIAIILVFYFVATTAIVGFGVNARYRFPVNIFILMFAISFLYDILKSRGRKLLLKNY